MCYQNRFDKRIRYWIKIQYNAIEPLTYQGAISSLPRDLPVKADTVRVREILKGHKSSQSMSAFQILSYPSCSTSPLCK